MDYFPLFANLKSKSCLVVGGGLIALRKIRLLRQAHADVIVVAPNVHTNVQELIDAHWFVHWAQRL